MRRVYRFGLRPPIEGESLVREQLRGAHDYANDLVAIERGRRAVLRSVDDTPDVRDAIEMVKEANRTTRKAAVTVLRERRKSARSARADDLKAVAALEVVACKGAYALARCAWGTRLDIAAAHQQARSAPLYEDDAITPSDPRFERGPRNEHAFAAGDVRRIWWLHDGQIAVQLQGGLSTADALRGADTRVRVVLDSEGSRGRRYGVLWLRVGSDGHAPVWARWPIKMHRAIPDSAAWKWVRVSLRHEARREVWSVEITVDDAAPHPHERDAELRGAVAVEWEWSSLDDGGIRVARWADTSGEVGDVVLSSSIAKGIRKPDGMRAVRDIVLDDLRPRLATMIKESKDCLPTWLREAGIVLHLWRSPSRFRELAQRWRSERCDAARPAYDLLDAWEGRENHLYDYECGARGEALRERRELYRVLAAALSRRYRYALLSDQDLSREAQWGEESDVRFTAAIYELRGAFRNAFGERDAIDARWRLPALAEDDERSWCERVRDAWIAGGARGDGIFATRKEKTGNAWAARKAKKVQTAPATTTARKPSGNAMKSLDP